MRTALAALVLAAALALNAVAAFAGDKIVRPVFFGDGFDNTTCADEEARGQGCK